ncbi:MAG: hypothetical protein ACU841_08575 [Gammaproteobacteria bacterium]
MKQTPCPAHYQVTIGLETSHRSGSINGQTPADVSNSPRYLDGTLSGWQAFNGLGTRTEDLNPKPCGIDRLSGHFLLSPFLLQLRKAIFFHF